MPTALQLRRGTTGQHSTFTGANGEVTIDTTKKTAVVHDGSTAGGFPLARESALTAYLLSTTAASTYLAISTAASTYAPLASPALTGTPTAPTASGGTNNTQIATTAFVQSAVAAAPQKFELIATATPSGATSVDFTGLTSGYTYYVIESNNLAVSADDTLSMRVSTDNGSTFVSGTSTYGTYMNFLPGGGAVAGGLNNRMRLTGVSSFTPSAFSIRVYGVGLTQRLAAMSWGSATTGDGGFTTYFGGGRTVGTTAVNAIRLYNEAGATLTGTIKLYGVKV